MIDKQQLEKIDKNGMYQVYDRWPEIAFEYFNTDFSTIDFGKIKHIVFAGMGGSGTIGDVFASILSKTNIHVDVVKGYILPKTVDVNSLVIITSVSGNTKESLNVLKESKKIGCRIVTFSDGGLIKKFSIENNIEYREIKMQHSPRASFVAYLFSMLKIFNKTLPIKIQEINETIEQMRILKEQIFSKNLSDTNYAITLAEWIPEIPLIYYPNGLQAAAIRFKNSLQENSKIHVISEDIIEACHNGIVPWVKSSNVKPILLRGKNDFEKTSERWEIIKKFFNQNKIEFKEIESIQGNILSKLANLIYLLDYVSIYKSVMDGIDPSVIEPINYIKENL